MILDKNRVLVRTENMSISYRNRNEMIEAVKDADIRIMQGEFVVIEGLRGTKKNVFFNVMGCLDRPTSGKYYYDYEDIALAEPDMLDSIRKNKIGYLFRNFNLIDRLTVQKNIEVPMQGLKLAREEKKYRLQKVLQCFDIEAIAEEMANRLSDYEKQMVSLARAVVNNPLMIIADEPAANLDGPDADKLMEHLFRLKNEGVTIMLISEGTAVNVSGHCRRISFYDGRVYCG